jgi:hypothetical protein
MNKAKSDELRPEYHRGALGSGVRGKYFESYRKGTNLILLSPDMERNNDHVLEIFSDFI